MAGAQQASPPQCLLCQGVARAPALLAWAAYMDSAPVKAGPVLVCWAGARTQPPPLPRVLRLGAALAVLHRCSCWAGSGSLRCKAKPTETGCLNAVTRSAPAAHRRAAPAAAAAAVMASGGPVSFAAAAAKPQQKLPLKVVQLEGQVRTPGALQRCTALSRQQVCCSLPVALSAARCYTAALPPNPPFADLCRRLCSRSASTANRCRPPRW